VILISLLGGPLEISLPQVEFCLGIRSIQVAIPRPDLKIEGSATDATRAVAMMGPMLGMLAGMIRTSCSSASSSRAQWCELAQASMPIRHGASFLKNRIPWLRLRRSAMMTAHATSTPWTRKTLFAISNPIVITSSVDGSFASDQQQPPRCGTWMPCGAVRPISCRQKKLPVSRRGPVKNLISVSEAVAPQWSSALHGNAANSYRIKSRGSPEPL
jgi:hypothetical protein